MVLFFPFWGLQAQETKGSEGSFRAVVLEILEQEEKTLEDGSKITQQNVKLKGIGGEWKDKEVTFYGISDLVVSKSTIYKKGDKVVVNYFQSPEGGINYYISDFVRSNSIYWLFLVFLIIVLAVGKWKGLAALISLALSFFIIMKMIVPMISSGYNPLMIAIIGSFFILFFIIYITEGYNKKAHFAILSIAICLIIIALLSYLFTYITRLSGMAQEEVLFLVAGGKGSINFQGLLLAGIVIGALGVLDDIVISQVESINQIKKANPKLNKKEVLKIANEIGSSHLGAIINTLFLAYAGISIPLLILFSLGQSTFSGFESIINSEVIATEIVRTLVGVIGITLSVPITNWLVVCFYEPKELLVKKTNKIFNVYKSFN